MAERSILWTTGEAGDGSSEYTQTDWFSFLKRTFGDGVVKGEGEELNVTDSVSPITVHTGAAIVNGAPYVNTTDITNMAVPTPVGGTTAHRVVLRWSDTDNTVRAVLLSAADGVSTPPALTTTPPVYEILLADLTITTGGAISISNHPDFVGQVTQSMFWPATSGINVTDAELVTGTVFGVLMANAKETQGFVQFICPADYIGEFQVTPVFQGVGTGDVVISADYTGGGLNEQYNNWSESEPVTGFSMVADERNAPFTTSLPDIEGNDIATAIVTRDALHIVDTLAQDISFLGILVTYTADGG
jgi:hypothetical protein